MTQRVGLFGGTFNPIHHGHLIGAQESYEALGLEEIIFFPTGNPPHKNKPETDINDRLTMTEKATASDDRFSVSDFEAVSDDVSYAINTINNFLSEKPDNTDLYYITGADELIDFKSWKNWKTIISKINLVGMSRPDFDRVDIPRDIRSIITFIDIPKIEISSTEIRRRLRSGVSARYFLPESVWNYISENRLYHDD